MRPDEFAGKTAIVTGAASGIGRGVAIALAQRGASVVLADVDARGVGDLAREITAAGRTCLARPTDVTSSDEVQQLVGAAEHAFGAVELLVTAAGGFPARMLAEDVTDEQWEHGLRLNLTSAFYCCRALIPALKSAGRGRIVTVSSAAGRSPSNPTTAFYAAAKAGLIGLTRALAHELGPYGVTVNAVAPGVTMTPRIAGLYDEEQFERLRSITPMRRIAQVEDQVAPVLFLLSDGARHITGATLDVNGGRIML